MGEDTLNNQIMNRLKKGASTDKKTEDEVIEEIVKESVLDLKEEENLKKSFEMLEELDKDDLKAFNRHLEILAVIDKLSRNQLHHATADHKANVSFGSELKAIHRFQSKFILIVCILVAICFTGFGMMLHSQKDSILPYADILIGGVKTATNIKKWGE